MENTIALLLTQYERYGSIGHDEYIQYFIDEELDVNISMLSDYNEYLINHNYYDDYIYDDLEEMLSGYSAMDIVRMIHFGKYNALDNYYKFDGYGNIESHTDTEIEREMKDNTDFLEWYIEENDLIDWDEVESDIEDANKLISQGY